MCRCRVGAQPVLCAQLLSILVCAGQHITVATIQNGQLQRTTMTTVPAPPPSVSIDSAGTGEVPSASTPSMLANHAGCLGNSFWRCWGILYVGPSVLNGPLLCTASWTSCQLASSVSGCFSSLPDWQPSTH